MALAMSVGACGESRERAAAPSTSTPSTLPAGDVVESRDPFGSGSWDGARTVGDGRELLVVVVGGPEFEEGNPCSVAYRPEVDETDTEVRVRFVAASPKPKPGGPTMCTSEGHFRTIRVPLSRPLGARTLTEVQFNRTQPVFDGSTLFEPGWLPDGYRLRGEGPVMRENASSWSRTWSMPRVADQGGRCVGGKASLSLVQWNKPLTAGDGPGAKHVDINGSPGTWAARTDDSDRVMLAWGAHGSWFQATSTQGCVDDVHLSDDELVRFARSLEAPRSS